ncbi:MAG: N-acetylmuramoyl-L-alanine amidase [Chloroflexi bacterium]|nr:N-acetylmuramoyl-L-alanine amidase [Chloroflexota bacterium]
MKLTIHRGTHEIGGSCVEVRSGLDEARIVIDLGMPLVQADRSPFEWRRYEQMPVEDLLAERVLPPVSGLYAHEEPTVRAVLISHAHQDHYGLLRFIHPEIPVYCSAGTRALIEVSNIFLNTAVDLRQIEVLSMWKAVTIGAFRVTPYLVDHSAPDAVAFVVETGGTKLFYSGDFRGHGRKKILFERMLEYPVQDVDCLLLEGTMLGRSEGDYQTEEDVEDAVKGVIESTDSYTFVFASSQNLDRLVSVYRAAIRCDAMFVIDLYTAFVLDRLKGISSNIPQANWRNVRVLYTSYHANKLAAVVSRAMGRRVSLKNRGVRRADFYVLRGTDAPAILVEMAFLSNRKDEARLQSRRFRSRIVEGIYAGILDYANRQEWLASSQ